MAYTHWLLKARPSKDVGAPFGKRRSHSIAIRRAVSCPMIFTAIGLTDINAESNDWIRMATHIR